MITQSPFTASRFEYEGKHLFFLPSSIFSKLRQQKPVFLVGSRGTGKTTLLKALHWQERLNNEWLLQALDNHPFSDRCLGVYMKLPDTILSAMELWLAQASEPLREVFVGLFFDFVGIQLIAAGASEIIAKGFADVSPADEHECVSHIVAEYPQLPVIFGRTLRTLRDVAESSRAVLASLQRACLGMRNVDAVAEEIPMAPLGTLGRCIGRCIAELLNGNAAGEPWHFKVCMDEAETLSSHQLLVLNTYVRLAEWPLFPVAAFVQSPRDISSTLRRDLTLTDDDCTIVRLDGQTPQDFAELAMGVADVRTQCKLGRVDVHLDLQKILGRLSINTLLHRILKQSASEQAHDLLHRAEALQTHPFFASRQGPIESDAGEADETALPIYQAYLVDESGLELPQPSDPKWKHRQQDSAELRKRMVAAYLSICEQLSCNVLYASSDMLLQLSDNCMRDFLRQLEKLFLTSGKTLQQFLDSEMTPEQQNKAFVEASEAKRDSIPQSELRVAAKEAGRVIRGLAELTSAIQKHSPDGSHLRSSERGIMRVTFRPYRLHTSTDPATPRDIVIDAAQAGFLRLLKTEGDSWAFRVHCSLAPAFGFSYRGAYYACDLSLGDLDALRNADDDDVLSRTVATIASRVQHEVTMPLFEEDSNAE